MPTEPEPQFLPAPPAQIVARRGFAAFQIPAARSGPPLNEGTQAYTYEDVGACHCGVTCSVTFTVKSLSPCLTAALGSGITVSVYDHSGGTLLAQGTTNGSSQVTLAWNGASGTYYVTADASTFSARFNDIAGSPSLTCGGQTVLAPSAASGYTCTGDCSLPIKNTLIATFTVAGACTLTQSGGNWSGTLAGRTISALGIHNMAVVGCSGFVVYSSLVCPPSLSVFYTTGTACPSFGDCTLVE